MAIASPAPTPSAAKPAAARNARPMIASRDRSRSPLITRPPAMSVMFRSGGRHSAELISALPAGFHLGRRRHAPLEGAAAALPTERACPTGKLPGAVERHDPGSAGDLGFESAVIGIAVGVPVHEIAGLGTAPRHKVGHSPIQHRRASPQGVRCRLWPADFDEAQFVVGDILKRYHRLRIRLADERSGYVRHVCLPCCAACIAASCCRWVADLTPGSRPAEGESPK